MTAYDDGRVSVHLGDCLDVLRTLPDASVDAVVTDPPYGLEFMGKEWDSFKGDAWRNSAGITGTGYTDGGKRLARPSFGGGDSANPTCATCGGRKRGAKKCACSEPDWRVKGKPLDQRNNTAAQMRAFQEWCELWAAECLRVLKPGGHMLAFGGTRTWHRLACAVEDAGFEVRDSIAWLYGSGFSKSWNFKTMFKGSWCECESETTDAGNPDLSRVRGDVHPSTVARSESQDGVLLPSMQRSGEGSGVGDPRTQGPSRLVAGSGSLGAREDDGTEESGMGGRVLHRRQGVSPGEDAEAPERAAERLRPRARPSDGADDRTAGALARGGSSHQRRPGRQSAGEPEALPGSHESLDDGALRDGAVCPRCGGLDPFYQGAGTGLKPAFEPVVVARKPLSGTVAASVLAHGTGALNIDATRIEGAFESGWSKSGSKASENTSMSGANYARDPRPDNPAGRWPANVVLDGPMAAALDEQSGEGAAGNHPANRGGDRDESVYALGHKGTNGERKATEPGGASRFFYVAKAPATERPRINGTAHPTVKPLDLMRWLVRLVTPPGGTVLEPFAGSGTTVEACIVEGFRCIAIEREPDYLPLILQRIHRRRDPVAAIRQTGDDLGLFELDGEPA